jgi:Kef-type K+ transport system membrane component KefB
MVIIIGARVMGWCFRKIHQPQVMGEMVAGILLGPSFLGWLAPGAMETLFPAASLNQLNMFSQIGLVIFMFLVGLELDPQLLRGRSHAAVVISHVSIIAPFFLGTTLALYLYPKLSDASVGFTGFALFMGAAMSVTAFPVLARILTECGLTRTRIGALTIACAAVDDVTAWCMLALVVAMVRATGLNKSLLFMVLGTALYAGIMMFVVRRLLRKLEEHYVRTRQISHNTLAIVFLLLLASTWTTEWLGIHALFGAFMLGVVMPKRPNFVAALTEKLEGITVVFLLPLFFAYTGLRTQIGLIRGGELWLDCLIIILIAVAGKLGGSAIAARASGSNWRDASVLGILMNTRGLMELVILNIGLDLGVISPLLFGMMVIMALTTTFMTTPIVEWLYPVELIITEQSLSPDRQTEERKDSTTEYTEITEMR